MSTRRAKQLIYGALYAAIILLFCFAVYAVFILPFRTPQAPACTPSTCAPTGTAPLAVTLVGTFITGTGQYTFLGQITNTDADYGAPDMGYEVDLYDATGTVIGTVPGTSFIYPGQSKYVLVPNIAIAKPFDHAAFVMTGAQWEVSSTLGTSPGIAPGQFSIQNVQAATAAATVSVGGVITNTSVANYRQVVVMVLFRGLGGAIVGASQTQLENVTAGETTNFSVIYPNAQGINPESNQPIVYALR